MGCSSKQRNLNRRVSDGWKTCKELLNILSHQGNADQNDLTSIRMAKIKPRLQLMLERMWSKGNTCPVLVGMQTYTATLEISIAVSQKIENQFISRPSNTTLGHIPKGYLIILQGNLLNYVCSSIICHSQNLETTRCPSMEEWIKKRWYI